MGRVADCLTLAWIHSESEFAVLSKGPVAPPLKQRVAGLKQLEGSDAVDQWEHEVRDCGERVELGHLMGVDPTELRRLCRETAKRTVAIVKKFKGKEETIRKESGVKIADAQKLAERHGGTWWRVGQAAGVEYRTYRHRCSKEFGRAMMLAALGGDQKLAQELAQAYWIRPEPVPTPDQHRLNNLVQHALRGDEAWLQAGTKRLESLARKPVRANPKDWPPTLLQYPLSVIRRDEKGLVEALNKTAKQFSGVWDPKTFAAKEAEIQRHVRKHAKTLGPKRDWFRYFMDPWKSHFCRHWVLSWWGLTWLSIAHFRGMTGVFDNSKNFSEWTPLGLCAPLNAGAGGKRK